MGKGTLLSFRKSIRIVDATIRDGGLCNSFNFEDEFVKALIKANIASGVDYMELGYRASKDLFDESKFGKWKFCTDDDVWKIIDGKKDERMKFAVMADVGRCDLQRDTPAKSESPIDLYRIAAYIHQIPAAIEMIEYCKKQGYETSCNIMAVSTNKESEIDEALSLLGQSPVDVIYLVDSFGSLYPEEVRVLSQKYLEAGEKYGKKIGIHCHNNQQLAFANTIEACAAGVDYLDGTVCGMGRGAGNCALEALLGFLKNPSYKTTPMLRFIENYMLKLRESGVKWGYDIPYLLTGLYNKHPYAAIDFLKAGRTDYADFEQELFENE